MRFRTARILVTAVAVAIPALAGFVPAARAGQLGVDIHIGNVPPPPRVVFYQRPHMILVPGTPVYVVDYDERPAYDMFRYGGYYWIYDDNYWYRASRYNGPFVYVETRYVPEPIYYVPAREWRSYPSNLPPGIAKKMYARSRWEDERGWKGRVHDRGRGRGHGRGHD